MTKILEAGFVVTKGKVEDCLKYLRAISELLKQVKKFEVKLRVSGKQAEAAALFMASWANFAEVNYDMRRLPWWIRTQHCCVCVCVGFVDASIFSCSESCCESRKHEKHEEPRFLF